ncbi:MAG: hypothetical protein QOF65_3070 [Thermoleophilaceae bacterium]|jgi:hypothetical protein|nr:hypothetical protein [Thermoleophilaceae bacterium]
MRRPIVHLRLIAAAAMTLLVVPAVTGAEAALAAGTPLPAHVHASVLRNVDHRLDHHHSTAVRNEVLHACLP